MLLVQNQLRGKNMNIVDKIDTILGENIEHERIWGKPKRSDYRDLGYANGWKNTPDIVEKCRKKKHSISGVTVSNCLHEYFCDICKYKYQVDSSG
jgi:hypothetical protein